MTNSKRFSPADRFARCRTYHQFHFFIKAGSAGVGANDKIGVGLIGCNAWDSKT